MLPAEMLTSLRGYINPASLPDTCVLLARTEGTDTGGGPPTTFPDGATVACRLSPVGANGGQEAVQAGVLLASAPWRIAVPQGTTGVQADDRVRHSSGRVFEVKLVGERTWGVVLNLYCEEVS